ncbi:hypothetical protein AAFF_G00391450 [Aldrovandia affinis]|uniref:Uncharacterized protein n=1 Tax=Aldrovandia affinis TaxID=143900 RepID=A0AAD7SG27_9TELE|nr:hypothetical protein AAFF_G00391450 [Aldrovandia affinis]
MINGRTRFILLIGVQCGRGQTETGGVVRGVEVPEACAQLCLQWLFGTFRLYQQFDGEGPESVDPAVMGLRGGVISHRWVGPAPVLEGTGADGARRAIAAISPRLVAMPEHTSLLRLRHIRTRGRVDAIIQGLNELRRMKPAS